MGECILLVCIEISILCFPNILECKKMKMISVTIQAIIDGLGTSIQEFSQTVQGIDADSIMQLVMMNQYFDTLKEVSQTARGNAIFVGNSGSSGQDFASQMRMSIMQAAPVSGALGRPAPPKKQN
eukprot:TRINITY_DN5279_c0_g1_i2.p1 TRINITY_DN5279_c0_g1~~TRINITY_DN5279_c0_g1_i2.p1  ORF type:complete len:125 (-),score=22.16 TRINITY_DN5279_c0_g1_i2:220-594(-)